MCPPLLRAANHDSFKNHSITTAPSLGPMFGGVLNASAGWRWVFWFLTITSAIVLLAIALVLPETARGVVGNGIIAPPQFSRPWLPVLMRPWLAHETRGSSLIFRQKSLPNPWKSLQVLGRPETTVAILGGSILYMVYCSSHASLSTGFASIYNLTRLQTGLVYLPFGGGSLLATIISGWLMNRDYKIVAIRHNFPIDHVAGDDLRRFPIEEARLRSIFIPTLLACVTMVGYGWSTHAKTVKATKVSSKNVE
jgi:MFS family permease